jgi:predicted ATP-grasp superfamily ATP-dependent carboligase
MSVTLGIIGASVRAATESALRAGFRVLGIDQFADRDCAAAVENGADFAACHTWLDRQARRCPDLAWMYLGGWENSAELVDRLARKARLLGVSGACLRQLRDPEHLCRVLRAGGFDMPEMVHEPCELPVSPPTARWLLKRAASAAGRGIEQWNAGTRFPEQYYLQREIFGESRSGAYLAEVDQCRLLGVFDALPPAPGTGARRFWYAGSIGPRPLSQREYDYWHALGRWIWQSFALRGLFGVDVVVRESEILVLEVNPRLTASMELLDRSGGNSVVAMHVGACLEKSAALYSAPADNASEIARNAAPITGPVQRLVHAKAILYATRPTTITSSLSDAWLRRKLSANTGMQSPIADIPWPGSRIDPGTPIVTVFGSGESMQDARTELCDQILSVRREIDADQHP